MDIYIETLTNKLNEARLNLAKALPDTHLYMYYGGKIQGIEFALRSLELLKS